MSKRLTPSYRINHPLNSSAVDYQYQVTVGIPVFNVEKYVEKALISALEQDFVLPYEILVVDDCGTDSSMDIVRHIVKTH